MLVARANALHHECGANESAQMRAHTDDEPTIDVAHISSTCEGDDIIAVRGVHVVGGFAGLACLVFSVDAAPIWVLLASGRACDGSLGSRPSRVEAFSPLAAALVLSRSGG